MDSSFRRCNRFSMRWGAGLAVALLAFATFLPDAAAQARPKVIIGVGIDATYGEICRRRQGIHGGARHRRRVQDVRGGRDDIVAAAAGTVQVGAAGELPGLKPVSDGARIVYVATGVYTGRSGGTGVVSGIKTPQDLVGKKWRAQGLDQRARPPDALLPQARPRRQSDRGQRRRAGDDSRDVARRRAGGLRGGTVAHPHAGDGVRSSVPWRYGSDGVYELHWGYWLNRDSSRRRRLREDAARALIQAAEFINANKDAAAESSPSPCARRKRLS